MSSANIGRQMGRGARCADRQRGLGSATEAWKCRAGTWQESCVIPLNLPVKHTVALLRRRILSSMKEVIPSWWATSCCSSAACACHPLAHTSHRERATVASTALDAPLGAHRDKERRLCAEAVLTQSVSCSHDGRRERGWPPRPARPWQLEGAPSHPLRLCYCASSH
jgi:hypothetical protein